MHRSGSPAITAPLPLSVSKLIAFPTCAAPYSACIFTYEYVPMSVPESCNQLLKLATNPPLVLQYHSNESWATALASSLVLAECNMGETPARSLLDFPTR